ncbi:hypothetical protein IHE44_0014417 [Lamprotornis superbus]|uniref:Uncharacterized protein n=1 Tax=Lamprotornis superbus TaxID=245042 RepID=A0A835TZJ5_9PASS|nr:hypothetical protein IHE44_0014417 [Lamprotornis superbus]
MLELPGERDPWGGGYATTSPPTAILSSNHILLKAGGGNANQDLQKGSGKAYIKGQKTRLHIVIAKGKPANVFVKFC